MKNGWVWVEFLFRWHVQKTELFLGDGVSMNVRIYWPTLQQGLPLLMCICMGAGPVEVLTRTMLFVVGFQKK